VALKDLPTDVAPDQVWKEGDQHWRVLSIHNGVATLQRCTPGGRVLNPRYKVTASEDRMHAEFVLVSSP
jgi:hypothetical protein